MHEYNNLTFYFIIYEAVDQLNATDYSMMP